MQLQSCSEIEHLILIVIVIVVMMMVVTPHCWDSNNGYLGPFVMNRQIPKYGCHTKRFLARRLKLINSL